MNIIKKRNNKYWEGYREKGIYIVVRHVNCCNHYGNQYGVPQKTKNRPIL
jgi:hypothetical protein